MQYSIERRPRLLSEIRGQSAIIDDLKKRQLNNRWPKSMLMRGRYGTGKCVVGSSLVLEKGKGLVRIKDYSTGVAGFSEQRIELSSFDGEETTSQFYEETVNKTIKLSLSIGAPLEGTEKHPLLTYNKGLFEYKQLGDMIIGDEVVLKSATNVYGEGRIDYDKSSYIRSPYDSTKEVELDYPCKLTDDLGFLIGCLIANGSKYKGNYSLTTFNPNTKEQVKLAAAKSSIPLSFHDQSGSIRIKHKRHSHFLSYLMGSSFGTARYKRIPAIVLTAEKKTQIAFLKALFECDASLHKGKLEYSTASETLSEDVSSMLINMGIVPYVRTVFSKRYQRDYFRVYLTGSCLDLWGLLSGDTAKYSFSKEKKARNPNLHLFSHLRGEADRVNQEARKLLQVRKNGYYGKSNLRFPNSTKLLFKKSGRGISGEMLDKYYEYFRSLQKICDFEGIRSYLKLLREIRYEKHLYFARVTGIKEKEEITKVYDVTLPVDHNFIVNGIVSHNTTTAMAVALAMQCKKINDVGEPCMVCGSCKSILEERYDRDTHMIDGSLLGTKDSVTDTLELVNISPMQDCKRLFLIEEANQLSTAAINVFHKILENPKDNVHFIFLTMDTGKKIPPSIQSRCQTYNFKPFSVKDTMVALKEIMEEEDIWESPEIPNSFRLQGLASIANASKGSFRDALQYLERCLAGKFFSEKDIRENLGIVDESSIIKILFALLDRDESVWIDLASLDPNDVYNLVLTVMTDALQYRVTRIVSNEAYENQTKQLAAHKHFEQLLNAIERLRDASKTFIRKSDLKKVLLDYWMAASQVKQTIPVRKRRT